jgi:hypothetical protein
MHERMRENRTEQTTEISQYGGGGLEYHGELIVNDRMPQEDFLSEEAVVQTKQ